MLNCKLQQISIEFDLRVFFQVSFQIIYHQPNRKLYTFTIHVGFKQSINIKTL